MSNKFFNFEIKLNTSPTEHRKLKILFDILEVQACLARINLRTFLVGVWFGICRRVHGVLHKLYTFVCY